MAWTTIPARRGVLCVALGLTWAGAALAAPSHLIFWKGSFASAREAATLLRKPILLHFATENPFDRAFDTVVYRDPDVVFFTGHTCLPFLVHGDSRDSESTALCDAYRVKDFPTVVLVRGDGTEIDRMIGAQTPRSFLIMLQNFVNDTNTLGNLRARLRRDTANLDVAFALAQRYELRAELDSAMWLMQAIVVRGADSTPLVQSASLHLAAFETRAFGRTTQLERLIDKCAIDTIRREAMMELLRFFERRKMIDSLRVYYRRAAGQWTRDAELLNNYAWFLVTQPHGDTQLADSLSATAVALEPAESEFLDTRAEVLSKLGRHREAIQCIDTAQRLRPDDATLKARREELIERSHDAASPKPNARN